MDSLQTLNQVGSPGLSLTSTTINFGGPSLGNAASCRCGSAGGGFPGMPSLGGPSALMPGAGVSPLGGMDSMSQMMLQTQTMMNQTLLQLMSLMMQLMTNQGGSSASGSGASSAVSSPSGGSSSGAASSSGGFGAGGGAPGMPAGTATGKKLADIARAEATNGDSNGGLCYRDVSRSLAKIGITATGASAYMAADQLAKNPKVKEVKVAQSDLPKLPAGAIVVWNKGAGHEHGHISISTGDGKEASDLMRNQITNYGTSFRVFMPQ
ncbi:hypothetical protein ABS71_10430 [bacterium SCN 62-11]|nr:hypothetical protein [Candidatus Eremiobacteraeota bacterium]ODT67692.1 MAG: hypothetical protein ABS71_10430 [bacterium SCN 62-11]